MKHLVVIATLLFLLPGIASAQCASPATSYFPNSILVCPSGDIPVVGPVNDAAGLPCAGATIFMSFNGSCASGLCAFPGQGFPLLSAVSNASGVVTYNPRIGGCCLAGGTVTFFDATGVVLAGATQVHSPDIDGDCQVRVPDFALFASAWQSIGLNCADLNGDSFVTVSDLAQFAMHFNH